MKRVNLIRKAAVLMLILCLTLPLATSGMSGVNAARTEADINAQIDANSKKAEQLEQQKKLIQAEIKEVQSAQGELNAVKRLVEQNIYVVQQRIDVLTENIELKNEAITAKQTDITELEKKIADTEREIELGYKKIEMLEEENELNLYKFAQLVKSNYMSGTYGYVDLLMNSENFYNLAVSTEVMKRAGEKNSEFMQSLLDAIDEQEQTIVQLGLWQAQLDADRLRCEDEKAELEAQRGELYEAMAELDNDMYREQSELWELASEISELQSEINGMYRQWNATNEEIEELNRLTEALIKERQNLNRIDYSSDGFIWPLAAKFTMITCDYGYDPWRGGQHTGIDVGNSGIGGSNIYAAQSGTVIMASWYGGYGNCVIIDHGGGISTLYAHIRDGGMMVSFGQEVLVGEVIGLVGTTGWSTDNHLHFEVRENAKPVNPWNYVSKP